MKHIALILGLILPFTLLSCTRAETQYVYDPNGNLIHKNNRGRYVKSYDNNGQLIHEKHSDGYEEWHEYDYTGHLIHKKDSNGHEEWYASYGYLIHEKYRDGSEEWYDSNRQLIHKKDSNGYEEWYDYDSNGHLIHKKDSNGHEEWHVGNLIHYKDSDGYEEWYDYDSNGHLIHEKHSDGYERLYDSNGYLIHKKDSDGFEEWHEYDSNGHLIHKKDSNGYEEWYDYDSNGHLIHEKHSDGYERLYDSNGYLIHEKYRDGSEEWYDSNRQLIHKKDSNGYEEWYDYDSNGHLIHKKDSNGHEEWYDYHLIHKEDSDGYEEKDGFLFRRSSTGEVTAVKWNYDYYDDRWLKLPSGFSTSNGKTVKWYDKQGICIATYDGPVIYDAKGIPIIYSFGDETGIYSENIHYNDMGLLDYFYFERATYEYWNNGNIKNCHTGIYKNVEDLVAWDIKGNIEKYQLLDGSYNFTFYFKDNKIIGCINAHYNAHYFVVAQYSPTGRLLKVQEYEAPDAHYDTVPDCSVIEEFIKNCKPIKEWNGDEWTEEDDKRLGLNSSIIIIEHLNNGGKIEWCGQTFSFVH